MVLQPTRAPSVRTNTTYRGTQVAELLMGGGPKRLLHATGGRGAALDRFFRLIQNAKKKHKIRHREKLEPRWHFNMCGYRYKLNSADQSEEVHNYPPMQALP